MNREEQERRNDMHLFSVLKTLAVFVVFLLVSHCYSKHSKETYRSLSWEKYRVLDAVIVDTKSRQEVKYIADKYEHILDSISAMEKKNRAIYDRYVYDKDSMIKHLKEFHDAMDGLEQGAAQKEFYQNELIEIYRILRLQGEELHLARITWGNKIYTYTSYLIIGSDKRPFEAAREIFESGISGGGEYSWERLEERHWMPENGKMIGNSNCKRI